MWMIYGVLSLIFTILNYLFTVKEKQAAQWASVCALSFTSLTLLACYQMVSRWVNKEDWAALMDVIPSMLSVLTGYVLIMIAANAAPALVWKNRKAA